MDRVEAIEILDEWFAMWRSDEERCTFTFGANMDDVETALKLAIAALREQEQLKRKLEKCQEENCRLVLKYAGAARREQEQSKWISVEEKPMPEGNEEYEVCCDYHGEKRIEIHKGWNTHCVTHWRPLPEPPEGGAEE